MSCQYCGTDNPQWEHGAVLGQEAFLGDDETLPAGTRICIIGTEQDGKFLHARCGANSGFLVCAVRPFWPEQVLKIVTSWYTEEQPAERWKDVR